MRPILTLIVVALFVSCPETKGQSQPPKSVSSSPSATDDTFPPMSYEQMLPELAHLSMRRIRAGPMSLLA